ncbi:MAG: GNAT family N-acetyltransferase [Candidatus Acidiferrales bacterium]
MAVGIFATIARMSYEDDFCVREATAADAPEILSCLRAAFAPFRQRYTPGAFLDTVLNVTRLEERMTRMKIFVAANNSGGVAGTIGCSVKGEEGHLRGMAVWPQLHGRGVAPKLLAAAENELRAAKCSYITLCTTAPLERAIHFYRRRGYHASGRVRDWFGMPLYEYAKRSQSAHCLRL